MLGNHEIKYLFLRILAFFRKKLKMKIKYAQKILEELNKDGQREKIILIKVMMNLLDTESAAINFIYKSRFS